MPPGMQTTAVRDGDHWVLNGEKWFSSGASTAQLALVMAKTDPDAPRHRQFSTFLVELPDPGYRIVRDIPVLTDSLHPRFEDEVTIGHAEVAIEDLVVPHENVLGGLGEGFAMGQHRLGYGRLRHGMWSVAKAQVALDMATQAGHRTLDVRRARRRPPGRPVDARRLRRAAVHHEAAHPAHRLQDGARPRPPPGELDRQELHRPHAPQRRRHRAADSTVRSATRSTPRSPPGTRRCASSAWSTAPTRCIAG